MLPTITDKRNEEPEFQLHRFPFTIQKAGN